MNSFFPNKYQLSFWDYDASMPERVDFCIIGAGFTGIGIAMGLRKKYPSAQIVVLEQLPQGAAASTKNAGFFCFGSPTEILDTVNEIGEEETLKLIEKRWSGGRFLFKTCKKLDIPIGKNGGYEIFDDSHTFQHTADSFSSLNKSLSGINNSLRWESKQADWARHKQLLFSPAEGQVHPGKLYYKLVQHLRKLKIPIIYNSKLSTYNSTGEFLSLTINDKHSLRARSLLLATNAFQSDIEEVKAARNIVFLYDIQGKIPTQANIHYDKGYVYMREVQGKFLIGGGRNHDLDVESTSEFGFNPYIENYLLNKLKRLTVLDVVGKPAYSWSGIISSGKSAMPLFKRLEKNVYYAGRYGGMGVTLSLYHGHTTGNRLEIE